MMVWHGMGSLSSPIVISDDEDDAYVELQLQDRLSDPSEYEHDAGMDLYEESYNWSSREMSPEPPPQVTWEVSSTYYPADDVDCDSVPNLKRKRSGSVESHVEPPALKRVFHPTVVPTMPPAESKTARKKRLRKERQEAQAQNKKTKKAGKPQQLEPERTHLPQGPALSSSSTLRESFTAASRPPGFSGHHDQMDLPQPIPLPLLHLHPAPPSFHPNIPLPQSIPYNPFLNLNFDPYRAFPPQPAMNIPTVSHPLPAPPPARTNAQSNPQQPATVKRIIGMPSDSDLNDKHSTFPSKLSPLPDPSRTLIMGMLPKKFRTQSFALTWSMSFDKSPPPKVPPRIEVDPKAGKTLIEFKTVQLARTAWGSSRFPPGEGKEHIRVWWYHEIEEGEIGEEGEIVPEPTPAPKKEKVKAKGISTGPPRSQLPGIAPIAPFVPTMREEALRIRTNLGSFASRQQSATSTTFSVFGEEAMDLGSDDGFEDRKPTTSLAFPAERNLMEASSSSDSSTTLISDLSMTSQASSSSTALSSPVSLVKAAFTPIEISSAESSSLSMSTSQMPLRAPTPTPQDSSLATSKPTIPLDAKQAVLARQKELEARIAQSRKEIAARTAESRAPSPKVGSLPTTSASDMPAAIIPTDQVPLVSDTTSAEEELRKLVVKSKSRVKTATGHSVTPSEVTSGAASTAATPTISKSSVNFDALAVSFITETIQTVAAPAAVKAVPAPVPLSKLSERELLNEKQKILERHIAESKVLMDRLQAARTKTEKDIVLGELRECRRTMEDAIKNFSQTPAALPMESRTLMCWSSATTKMMMLTTTKTIYDYPNSPRS
ncbi:unnamed protein product [Somion occarium]|uniref:Uncharacterized protein n=1 Tax=Somion occarium TaxID=3059160 RepID=A0ABP1CTQ1_9APHY